MCFLSLFVSIQVSYAYVKVLFIIVFFSLNFSFLDIFLFLKNLCSTKYVLLAFFILSCNPIWWLLSALSTTPKHLKFPTLSNYFLFLIVLFCFALFFCSTIIHFVFLWFMCRPNCLAMLVYISDKFNFCSHQTSTTQSSKQTSSMSLK